MGPGTLIKLKAATQFPASFMQHPLIGEANAASPPLEDEQPNGAVPAVL